MGNNADYSKHNSFVLSNLNFTVEFLVLYIQNRLKEELSGLNKQKDKVLSNISSIEFKISGFEDYSNASTVSMSNKDKKRFKKERSRINATMSIPIEIEKLKAQKLKHSEHLEEINKKISAKDLEIVNFPSVVQELNLLELFQLYSSNTPSAFLSTNTNFSPNLQYPIRSYSTISTNRNSNCSLLSSNKFIRNSGVRLYSTDATNINYFIDSPIYLELQRLLNTSILNTATQAEIEKFLNDQGVLFLQNKIDQTLDINYYKINPLVLSELKKSISELEFLINNYRSNLLMSRAKDKSSSESLILTYLEDEEIVSLLLGRLLRIISNTNQYNKHTNCTVLGYELGQSLVYIFYTKKYNEYLRLNKNVVAQATGLQSFVEENYSNVDKNFTDSFKLQFGLKLLNLLEEVKLIHSEILVLEQDQKSHHFVANTDILENIGKYINISNSFSKIPMIVKPKDYGKEKGQEKLGGYILNDQEYFDPLIIKNHELKDQSIIADDNIVYDTVNNLSSVAYKINTPVLNFVLNKGLEYELYIDPNFTHELELKKQKGLKLTIFEKKKLSAFLSRKQLEMNILGLALIFKNVPEFYIPVRIDNRGRIYCMVDYLHYQSIELSKSLLVFSKGEKVFKGDKESIDYLKIFGANCFGNGIDKKSYNDRVE